MCVRVAQISLRIVCMCVDESVLLMQLLSVCVFLRAGNRLNNKNGIKQSSLRYLISQCLMGNRAHSTLDQS